MTLSDLTENINVTQSVLTDTIPLSIKKTYRNSPNTADICDVTKWKKLAKADYVLLHRFSGVIVFFFFDI